MAPPGPAGRGPRGADDRRLDGAEATSGARARVSSGRRSPARLPERSAAERALSAQCAPNHRPIISYASRAASMSPVAAGPVICSARVASSATRRGSGPPFSHPLAPASGLGHPWANGLPRAPTEARPAPTCLHRNGEGRRRRPGGPSPGRHRWCPAPPRGPGGGGRPRRGSEICSLQAWLSSPNAARGRYHAGRTPVLGRRPSAAGAGEGYRSRGSPLPLRPLRPLRPSRPSLLDGQAPVSAR